MKQRSPVVSTLLSILVTLIGGGIYFYIAIPALNPKSFDFYLFLIVLCVLYMLAKFLFSGDDKQSGKKKKEPKQTILEPDGKGGFKVNGPHRRKWNKPGRGSVYRIPMVIIGLCLLVCVVGSVISAVPFHAKAYRDLLQVETGDFAQDVAEISYNKIPMLDADSAKQLGRRAMGSISQNSNLVSQFEVSDYYTQINYQGNPVRVSPLEYGNVIKWFNNRSAGLPGYIVVNMVTQEARLVQLKEGMQVSTCEHFNRNLRRYLRFRYPTYLFGDINFEVDEDGTPYWICSRVDKTIGLFGGEDIRGAVLVNAVTGEHTYYEKDVPTWVDRVYDPDIIMNQYDFHGKLVNGWINSWLGQKAVTTTTAGYNYIALNDEDYMYTGVTSAGSDESNVGFLLVNQRTKAAKYYNVTGAEEYSAMSSAQGAVQHLNYAATFPLLLNISDQPTYFMALKDSAELVKMYAMVNVSDYQITATGTTVAACQKAYQEQLAENGIEVKQDIQEEEPAGQERTVTGEVAEIRSSVISGNTWYYFRLKGKENACYYGISAADCPEAVTYNKGDQLTITYPVSEDGTLRKASEIKVK